MNDKRERSSMRMEFQNHLSSKVFTTDSIQMEEKSTQKKQGRLQGLHTIGRGQ
jgi:hypothetical protein